GQEEGDRHEGGRRLRRRHGPAPHRPEGHRAAQARRRRESHRCGRSGRQTQDRGGAVMAVLVIADHDGAAVRETTHKTVTAAAKLGGDVDILVVGKGAQAAADAAANIAGVRKVLLAESPALGHQLAEAVEATVMALADGYDAVL